MERSIISDVGGIGRKSLNGVSSRVRGGFGRNK